MNEPKNKVSYVGLYGEQVHVMRSMESWVAVKDEAKWCYRVIKKGNNPKDWSRNRAIIYYRWRQANTGLCTVAASAPCTFPFLCNLFIINERRVKVGLNLEHLNACHLFLYCPCIILQYVKFFLILLCESSTISSVSYVHTGLLLEFVVFWCVLSLI